MRTARDKLLLKADKLLREHRCILILVGGLDEARSDSLTETATTLQQSPMRQLRIKLKLLEESLEERRQYYHIRASSKELLDLLESIHNGPPGKSFLLMKMVYNTLFEPGSLFVIGDGEWPRHARIALNDVPQPKVAGIREFHLLEVILFESMCASFNLAKQLNDSLRPSSTKREIKEALAATRTGLLATFSFLESYVNGVACDYFLGNEESLNPDQKDILLDRNHISFKEKISKYQRIILNVPHPRLQASNCPELEYLIRTGTNHRNALVHASVCQAKEESVYYFGFSDLQKLVDSTVTFARRFAAAINLPGNRLHWIFDRGADGFFPPEVFD